jgi:uncharacterized protein (DUF697 family)
MSKNNKADVVEEMTATEMFGNEETKPFLVDEPISDQTAEVGSKNYRALLAVQTVKSWSTWAAAAGVIPVPVLDLAAIGGLQVKMVSDLCKIYDLPYKKETLQSLLGGLAGGTFTVLASGYLSTSLFRYIPYAGPVLSVVVQPGFAFVSTFALGQIFIRKFESGQSLAGLTAEAVNSAYHEQLAKTKSLFKKKEQETAVEVLDPTIHSAKSF